MQDLRLSTFLKCLFIALLSNSILYSTPISPSMSQKFKIVIDPGHGGKDHGTSGDHLNEKDVTLLIGLELGERLKQINQNIEIIFTREQDNFLPVRSRVALANAENADLFISLHCNSIKNKNPSGIETYVLGLTSSEENLEVVKRENGAILFEEDFVNHYPGFDPNSPSGHIILSAVQNSFMNEGIELAHHIQTQFSDDQILRDRGVKQESFIVLRNASMPAILIEAGFLSNSLDEQKIMTDESRKKIVNAMAIGIAQYVEEQNMKNTVSTYVDKGKMDKTYSAPPSLTAFIQDPVETTLSDQYKILMASSANGPLSHLSLEGIPGKNVTVQLEGGIHNYYLGFYSDLSEAIKDQANLREIGYKGAYVVKNDHVSDDSNISFQSE